jgi:hypothetical protein
MSKCAIAAALLLTSTLTVAQSPQMSRWLNTGTEKERVQKLVSLGVEEDQAKLVAGDEVEWKPLRSESQQSLALLFLPCDSFEESFLYLLERSRNGWHAKDKVGFDCHYDDSVRIEATWLRSSTIDDILVHHECEERGTGYLEQHFNVFAVSSGKLRIILNTKEVVSEYGWPEKREFHQRSKFAVLPTQELELSRLKETRCINNNGKISVQERQFRWDESTFRLVPSDFLNVRTIDRRTRAICH